MKNATKLTLKQCLLILMLFFFANINQARALGYPTEYSGNKDAKNKSGCTETPIIDFEGITLDGNPYRHISWGTPISGLDDNPGKDEVNGSDKVLRWEKNNLYGGLGIFFPAQSTIGEMSLKYDIYSTIPLVKSTIHIRNTEEITLGSYTMDFIIEGGKWVTVETPVFNLTPGEFSMIFFQPGFNQEELITIYIDNVIAHLCKSTSFDNLSKNPDVILYPNPVTSGEITIKVSQFKSKLAKIEILDLTGKRHLVKNVEITDNTMETTLDVSKLAPSLYLVKISCDNLVLTSKLIVD